MDLSFSGAGLMGVYYCGTVDFLRRFLAPGRVDRITGTSAGVLVGSIYVLDMPIVDCLRELLEPMRVMKSRLLGPFDSRNRMVNLLARALDRLYPEDAHLQVSGKIFLPLANMTRGKRVLVSEFETRQELIDAMNCGCFIMVWSGGSFPKFRGEKCIDGGNWGILPVFDENTLKISPVTGSDDMEPMHPPEWADGREPLKINFFGLHMHLTWFNLRQLARALWPYEPEVASRSVRRGFEDARRFLLEANLIRCDSCFAQLKRSGELHKLVRQRRAKTPTRLQERFAPIPEEGEEPPNCPPGRTSRCCEDCDKLREEAKSAQLDGEIVRVLEEAIGRRDLDRRKEGGDLWSRLSRVYCWLQQQLRLRCPYFL